MTAGRALFLAVLLAGASPAEDRVGAPPFSSGKTTFAMKVRDEIIPYGEFAVPVLPGEEVSLEVVRAGAGRAYVVEGEGAPAAREGERRWKWDAPGEAGAAELRIRELDTGETMTLRFLVVVRAEEVRDGVLNGYRIGEYPKIVFRSLPQYRPPKGFVEVTAENRSIRVSPHFRLEQFLCKQEGDFPKYVVLRERLLLKLEYLLEQVNRHGYRCDTFAVLSGFRTPHYNRLIGNVMYSRHMWGGAADIYIDESPRDGEMDDLNGDGRIDVEDARVLYAIVDASYGASVWERFLGGLGLYRRNARHGPFVHVDARGYRARWGD